MSRMFAVGFNKEDYLLIKQNVMVALGDGLMQAADFGPYADDLVKSFEEHEHFECHDCHQTIMLESVSLDRYKEWDASREDCGIVCRECYERRTEEDMKEARESISEALSEALIKDDGFDPFLDKALATLTPKARYQQGVAPLDSKAGRQELDALLFSSAQSLTELVPPFGEEDYRIVYREALSWIFSNLARISKRMSSMVPAENKEVFNKIVTGLTSSVWTRIANAETSQELSQTSILWWTYANVTGMPKDIIKGMVEAASERASFSEQYIEDSLDKAVSDIDFRDDMP